MMEDFETFYKENTSVDSALGTNNITDDSNDQQGDFYASGDPRLPKALGVCKKNKKTKVQKRNI